MQPRNDHLEHFAGVHSSLSGVLFLNMTLLSRAWVPILILPASSWVTLGKSLNVSEAQFLPLQKGLIKAPLHRATFRIK